MTETIFNILTEWSTLIKVSDQLRCYPCNFGIIGLTCFRHRCSCKKNFESNEGWNCFAKLVKQFITYVITDPFKITTSDKDVESFLQSMNSALGDEVISGEKVKLKFQKLSSYYVSVSGNQAVRRRRNSDEEEISVYVEVEYGYKCEFGNECTDFAENLQDNPPDEELRKQIESGLDSGLFYTITSR